MLFLILFGSSAALKNRSLQMQPTELSEALAEEELGIPLGKKLGVLWAREPCTGLYWQDWSQQVRKGEEGAVLCVVRSVPARGSVGVLGWFSVPVCSQVETAAWTSEILQLEWKKETRAGEMVT